MHRKFARALVAAAVITAAPSFAAVNGATSGNGELVLNLRSYVGNRTSGGNDISAMFDLGVSMNEVLSWNGQPGFSRTWNLITGTVSGTGISGSAVIGNYGSAWANVFNFVSSERHGQIEFNVIALDNTNKNTPGGSRYLTTAERSSYPGLTNNRLNEFELMNAYVNANNVRGTHATSANGASTAVPTDASNSYFGNIAVVEPDNSVSYRRGDNWLARTIDTTEDLDSTQSIASGSNFWFLTTSNAPGNKQANKTAFGFDRDGDGQIENGEFSGWSVDRLGATITFATPVPEMHSWAMLLAGIGIVGMVVRRRATY